MSSENIYTELFEKADLILIELDAAYNVLTWNNAAKRLFGYESEEVVGRPIVDFMEESEDKNALQDYLSGISSYSNKTIKIFLPKKERHEDIYTHWYCLKVIDPENNLVKISAIIKDITQQEMAKEALKDVEKELHDIFASAPIGIYQADLLGQFKSANPELAWMLGYESAQILISEMRDMAAQMFDDEKKAEEFFFNLFEAEQLTRFRCKLRRKDGSTFWSLSYAQITRNEEGRMNGFYGFSIDITNTVRAEKELQRVNEELKRISVMDGLTQIYNRRRFDECLYQEWKRLSREHNTLALIISDIDFFKFYNDTYGHQAGDDCLYKVAQVFKNAVHRPADLAARYGGEEFVLILPNTEPQGAIHIAELVRTMIRDLNIPHEKSKTDKIVTVSMGVSTVVPSNDHTPDDLIRVADRALYEAKKTGRDRLVYRELKPKTETKKNT